MHQSLYFIVWRYLCAARHNRAAATLLIVSFFCIALSTAALLLVAAVMQGFEYATVQQMRCMHADLEISSWAHTLNVNKIKDVIRKEFPDVQSVHAHAQQYGMVYDDSHQVYDVITLQGIEQEENTHILRTLKHPQHICSLQHILHDDQVIIGTKMARHHAVSVGDTLSLFYIPDQDPIADPTLKRYTVTVSGIFSMGIEEYDNSLMICSLHLLQQLFPDAGVSTMHVTLTPHAQESHVLSALQERLQLDVYSWKDLYPSLFAAAKLEKYAALCCMMIIVCIASINIMALLYVIIQQKRTDIALLAALGASYRQIRTIFMSLGLIVAVCACITGIFIALSSIALLYYYPIKLPDAYIVSHLPVQVSLPHVFFLGTLVMLISIAATYYATRSIRSTQIAQALKGV